MNITSTFGTGRISWIWFALACLFLLVLPAFYAAYRYAYRSPQVSRAEEPSA